MTAEQPNDDEVAAWRELLARWEDDAAHRAFLARFADLEGLARAGALYRGALAERPDDPVARRWRDEVVRRATAAGLASLPRTAAGVPQVPRWVRPAALVALGVIALGCAVLLLRTILEWGRP